MIVKVQRTAGDQIAAERFRREAVVMGRLCHPNIVALYRFLDGDPAALVMEFVPGRTLGDLVAADGWLTPARAAQVIEEVAAALDCAHAQGVIHRDVKPSNILLSKRGPALLTDFGVAHIDDDAPLTVMGDVLGTIEYASPEQVHGNEAPDARSDVYSLAAVAYFALTGTPPFRAADASTQAQLSVMHRQVFAEPPPLRFHREDLAPEVEAAVLRGLAKSPASRYPSAGQFAATLRAAALRAASEAGAGAALPAPVAAFSPLSRRRGALAGALAALLLLGAVALWKSGQVAAPQANRPTQVAQATPKPQAAPPVPVSNPPAPAVKPSVAAMTPTRAAKPHAEVKPPVATTPHPAPKPPVVAAKRPVPRLVHPAVAARPPARPAPSGPRPASRPVVAAARPVAWPVPKKALVALSPKPAPRKVAVVPPPSPPKPLPSLPVRRTAQAPISLPVSHPKTAWLYVYANQNVAPLGPAARMANIPPQSVWVDGYAASDLAAGRWTSLPAGRHLISYIPDPRSGFGPRKDLVVMLDPGARVSRQILLPRLSGAGARLASAAPAPSAPAHPVAAPAFIAWPRPPSAWYTVSGWVAVPAGGKTNLARASADWVKVDGQPVLALALGQWATLTAGKHTVTFQPTAGIGVGPKTWAIDLAPQAHLSQQIPLPPLAAAPPDAKHFHRR